jgi:hypothetical protein
MNKKLMELVRMKQVCEQKKSEVLEFYNSVTEEYNAGELTYSEYRKVISKSLGYMSVEDWVDYIDHYIEEIDERISSYGTSHKVYKASSMALYVSLFLILAVGSMLFLPPSITGAAVANVDNVPKDILFESLMILLGAVSIMVLLRVRMRAGRFDSVEN